MLLSNLNLLAQAPNGVARLRELILTLAVQGKLVPQDPKDEPASELLKKIRVEKDRLITEGKIKRDKPLAEITEEEKPFDLPRGWEWVRLPEIYYSISPSSNKLLSSAVQPEGTYPVVDQGQRHIAGYTDVDALLIHIPGPVIVFGDHTKAIKYIDFDFVAGADGTKILRPVQQDERFFTWQLRSFPLEDRGYARHFKVLNSCFFALPPLTEQSRIVTRVGELMRLCDALEAKGQLEATQHAQLVSTLLGTLTDSETPTQLADNWHRIATHFDLLLDRPQAVDALEQTILQLAVRGLLVPQDPQDESASELLKKVRAEKDKLIAEGKIKRDKPLLPIAENEQPFALPRGWEWVRFGDASMNRDGERVPVSSSDRENRAKTYDYYGASGVIDKIDCFLFDKTLLLIGEDGANLINRSTPIAFLAHGKYWVNNHAHVIDTTHPELMTYLELFINAISLEPYVTGTAQPKMNQAKLNSIVIALPTLAEQSRIVTRVAQLRRLCADLRQRLAASQSTQAHLAEALVQEVA